MNNAHFTELMFNVDYFVIHDPFRIADLIGTDRKNILDLVYYQYVEDERTRKEQEEKEEAERTQARQNNEGFLGHSIR